MKTRAKEAKAKTKKEQKRAKAKEKVLEIRKQKINQTNQTMERERKDTKMVEAEDIVKARMIQSQS